MAASSSAASSSSAFQPTEQAEMRAYGASQPVDTTQLLIDEVKMLARYPKRSRTDKCEDHVDGSGPSSIVQPELTTSSGVAQLSGESNDADHVDGSGPSNTVQPVVNIKDIAVPRVLKPLARSLANSIKAFGYTGIDQEEYYKLSMAYQDYVEWRQRQNMHELDRTHANGIYRCLKGLLAVYHPDVQSACFSKRCTRAEEAYRLFCETTVPLQQLADKLKLSQERALLLLATAARDRQQTEVSAFLPHAQRYINELAAMTFKHSHDVSQLVVGEQPRGVLAPTHQKKWVSLDADLARVLMP